MKKNVSNLFQATKQFILIVFLLAFTICGAMAQMRWTNPTGIYSGNMNIMAVVILDGVEFRSDMLEVGAFYEDECRGTIMTEYFPFFDKYLCFLMVYGDGSVPLTFKVYDHETDMEYNAGNTMTYNTNDIIGNPVTPYEFMIHSPHTITATAGANGTITPAGEVSVSHAANQNFTIIPENCYEIDEVLVDNELITLSGNTYTFEDVDDDHTIHVTFKQIIYTTPVTASICNGESYDFFGTDLTMAGTYNHTLQTIHGCDSIIELTLTVNPIPVVDLGEDIELEMNESVTLSVEPIYQSYLWSTGETTSQITVSREIFQSDTSMVWVVVTTMEGCTGSDTIQISFKLSINTYTQAEYFRIYPNPANGIFYIEFDEPAKRDIQVFDLIGRTILKGSYIEQKIELNLLHTGTYIVNINNSLSAKVFIMK